MIAIKGIDMPANCDECPLTYPVGFYRNLPCETGIKHWLESGVLDNA